MAALTSDPLVGRTVDGRYDVVRRIARGGMATVYLATDRRLDRRVALKVMHPHLADGTDVVARFRREARAAARLAHPGIVAVLDQGVDGETSYLTMEYVPGHTLRTEIAGHGSLRLGDALTTTEGVLDALAAAHRAGLVHRDVKPENVLVMPSGQIKVGDFGLARAVTEATAASTGTLLGTVAYLSPEIVSSGTADARADVYAVGIMLYEMLTGVPPFDGVTPIQIAYRHVHEDVPPPSAVVPWLPMDVDDIVAELTARDPAQRPGDAAEALALVRRLRRSLDERALGLRAAVPGRPELLLPPEPEPEFPAEQLDTDHDVDHDLTQTLDRGPGTGTIALPIGAVAPPPPPPPVRAPKPPRRRRRAWVSVLVTLLVLLLTGGAAAGWWFYFGPGVRVVVPVLEGLTRTEAEAQLRDLELVPEVSTQFSDDVAANVVISASQVPGIELPRGETIELVVSDGVEHHELRNVVDLTRAAAEAQIVEDGMAVGEVTSRTDRNVPEGTVLEQDPASGSHPHDTVVNLVVSDGPEIVKIESDYVGWSAESATASLATLLDINPVSISPTEVFHDDIDAGQVISVQIGSPPAAYEVGAEFPQGSIVTMTVSKGPDLVEVPDVFRMSVEEATEVLEEEGFVVDARASWFGLTGEVRAQDPEAGTMLRRGSTVVITYV